MSNIKIKIENYEELYKLNSFDGRLHDRLKFENKDFHHKLLSRSLGGFILNITSTYNFYIIKILLC